MTRAEGRQTDQLARGERVAGGPGACARPGCAHARIWHSHADRRHPCERCDCARYVSARQATIFDHDQTGDSQQ